MTRFAARLAVATLVVASVGLGVTSPAQASTCRSAKGVSVVVDFHELGGGVQTFCDAGGAGRTADAQLRDAGHQLTYVQRQPGFICRIDGKPTDDPCVNTPPADAYWSLWWSDGKSGKWAYSSSGASSLKVPAGGYVGMSWQGSDSKAQPGVSPKPHAAAQPSSSPSTQAPSSPHPSSTSGQQPPRSTTAPSPTATTSGTTATPAQRAEGTGKKQHLDPSKAGQAQGKSSHGPDRTPAAGEPLGQVATSADDSSGSDGSDTAGLPAWVAPVAIAVLFIGAGTIALVRRKSSGGP